MPPAEWVSVPRADLAGSIASMGLAALQAAARLLQSPIENSAGRTIEHCVAERLAKLLGAERVELVVAGDGCRPEWSWPSSGAAAADRPASVVSDALDRGAAAAIASADGRAAVLVCPLDPSRLPNRVILASRARRPFSRTELELAVALVPALTAVLLHCRTSAEVQQRVARLEALLEVSRQLAVARDTQSLMERLATESTRLLDADRASIFVWDRASRQVVARPALGMPGGELRLADHVGVVGDVLKSGQPTIVNDVRRDPRFASNVDTQSGYQTRSLLCVPLVDLGGQCVGVFEAINKKSGPFTAYDQATLELLAAQAAVAIESTTEREALVRTNAQLTSEAQNKARIVGDTPQMQALRASVERVAGTELPVLILGESGTGKDVVARAIHYGSRRAARPFIAVNCAAIAETLLESELFGHEKGAFTDARDTRQGKFELASGGTLFLDEIGDMSAGGQAKLLRVLEEKIVYRVGGSQPIHTDVRIIAATNRNLADAVQAGKFRQDLFFRLTVVAMEIPALRTRRDDVIPLAEHFLDQFCRDARRPRLKLSAEARKRLIAHEWPGNVRELRNLMERLAFLSAGPAIEPGDLAFILMPLSDAGGTGVPTGLSLTDATDRFQRDYITAALDRSRGNQAEAARLLGLHRSNLYRKMRQLGMDA
jgi:Nif-specific regulatory protein